MTGFPCQTAQHDLWFADDPLNQDRAALMCEGCPLKQHDKCRKEGWNHEHGVWGGLTPIMRKRMDSKRYNAALANAEQESSETDEAIRQLNARRDSQVAVDDRDSRGPFDNVAPAFDGVKDLGETGDQSEDARRRREEVDLMTRAGMSTREIALRLGKSRRAITRARRHNKANRGNCND